MAASDKRFIGETYSRDTDGGAAGKWRSRHSRRMSWANLAAQEIPAWPPRQSIMASTTPTALGRRSLSNPTLDSGRRCHSVAASASPAPGALPRHTVGGLEVPEAGKRSSEASRRSAHRQNSMPGLRKGQSAGGETPTTPSRASSKASVGGGAKRGSSSEAEEPMPRFFSEEPAAQKPAMPAERPHTRRNSRVESKLDRVDEIVELCRIAKALKIPQATIKQGADLFKEFGSTQGIPIKDWRMNETQFKKVMCRLTNRRSQNEEIFMQEAFWYADADRSGVLDFIKFVVWLSNNSFSEDLNLDESQKGMRALARKHGVHYALIDRYKRAFDEFDQDSSGGIDPEEFENLIYKCGKVPHKLGLPASRVQQWWRDADKDGNGVVDFEEFLVFQRKYFDEGNSGQASGSSEARRSGFENYYRGIRKHCWT